MLRKSSIVVLLSITLAIFTIAVRAERHPGRIESHVGQGHELSTLPFMSRLVSSSIVSRFLSPRQEETYLILQGCVFLLLGFSSLKRARRDDRAVPE